MSRNRLSWLGFSLLVITTMLGTGRRLTDWRYASWAESGRLMAASLIVVLPVLTLAVLLYVGCRKDAGVSPSRLVRTAVAAALGGWLLGLVPLVVWSVRTAGDSPPVLFLMVPAGWVVAIALAVAVGAQTFDPRKVLAVAGVGWAGAIAAVLSTGTNSRWFMFLPFAGMSESPSGTTGWNSWLALLRLTVAAAIAAVALIWLRVDGSRRTTAGWTLAGVVVASIAVPVPAVVSATPEVVCQDGRVRVCLLTEHRPDLPAVSAQVERAAAAAGPQLFPFTVASEVVANSPTSIQLAVGAELNGSNTLDVAAQLAASIARIDRCAPPEDGPADPAYRLVAFWFAEQSGAGGFVVDLQLRDRLESWRKRPAETTAALRALTGRLDRCELTMDDLKAVR